MEYLMSAAPTINEFPIELGELLKSMMKLAIDPLLVEKVLESAMHNELLYHFGHKPNTPQLQQTMKLTIQVWCDIVYEISGWEIHMESFELK